MLCKWQLEVKLLERNNIIGIVYLLIGLIAGFWVGIISEHK